MFLNNTNSELFEDCPRKFFWSRIFDGYGLESVFRNDNLAFGTATHIGLANYYTGKEKHRETTRQDIEEFLNLPGMPPEERSIWKDNIERVDSIVEAYEPYAKENDDFTVIQIEAEGCVVLGEICYLCGAEYPVTEKPEDLSLCSKCEAEVHHYVFRVDLAVNKGLNVPKVNILDHKTTSSLGDTYLLSWHNSFQMFGYCYGYEKASGVEVSGYIVNVIRKLKSIGREKDHYKTCPDCRNGVKKRILCVACKGAGKVERDFKPDEQPFVREQETWDADKKELFVRQRYGTAKRIGDEIELSLNHPDEAWPMNPKSCFKMGRCPFWKLCYTPRNVEKWYLPTDDQLINFIPRPLDYVSVKQLAREEMV